jgi:monofunctional biosynthetic peptidoglycan transglycosylase
MQNLQDFQSLSSYDSDTKNKNRFFRRSFKLFFLVLLFLGSILYFKPRWLIGYSLPPEKLIFDEIKPPSAVEYFDSFGRVIGYVPTGDDLFTIYRPLSKISKYLQDFVVFSEDAKFLEHSGFDVEEIKNSIEEKLNEKKRLRGASTITQQLAKNLFLDKSRSFVRKLIEVPWTLSIENDLTKKQILELYLNVIEWGPGIHGAELAARHFFDTSAAELTQGQALFLTLIIPNPVRFDPFANSAISSFLQDKRRHLITRWVREKKLTGSEASNAIQANWSLELPQSFERKFAPFHSANYFGNRFAKNNLFQALLEKKSQIWNSPKKRKLLSLNWSLHLELNQKPIRDSDTPLRDLVTDQSLKNKNQLFLVLLEGSLIRAFRKISLNKSFVDDFILDLEKRSLRIEFLEDIPWSNLAI